MTSAEEMSLEEAMARLKNGDLYDRKGDLTKKGYQALERLEGVDLNPRNPEDFATVKPEKTEPPVATSRIEDRLLRLEKIISLLMEGMTIKTVEYDGRGITGEDIQFLTQAYKNIREEHHFENDPSRDNHQ